MAAAEQEEGETRGGEQDYGGAIFKLSRHGVDNGFSYTFDHVHSPTFIQFLEGDDELR